MGTTKKGKIVIDGDDFSWIEENKKDLKQPEVLDANVRIALRLRKCMKERGWSQKDLAFALDVSPQYVNKILRNQDPSFSVKIAEEYGRRLNYPLIRVCDDKTDECTRFVSKEVLCVKNVFSSVNAWSLWAIGTKGFHFALGTKIHEKQVTRKSFTHNYA
ncbi:MAG: helix-turn-helix transcriptional regulator [Bacteroidales bacterium]|nr:helix-turn-helix transcriptional regulator [Bacteroidales bacterium]